MQRQPENPDVQEMGQLVLQLQERVRRLEAERAPGWQPDWPAESDAPDSTDTQANKIFDDNNVQSWAAGLDLVFSWLITFFSYKSGAVRLARLESKIISMTTHSK